MSSTLPTSAGMGILPALIGGRRLGDADRRARALLNRSSLKTLRHERKDRAMDNETTRPPTALITGASNGIGYELAKRFAQDRAGLVLVARSGEKLATVADKLRSLGAPNVEVVVVDLARADSVPALLRALSN